MESTRILDFPVRSILPTLHSQELAAMVPAASVWRTLLHETELFNKRLRRHGLNFAGAAP